MYVNVFATLFSLLAPRGRTQEFLTHNNLRIFHYFPVYFALGFFPLCPDILLFSAAACLL